MLTGSSFPKGGKVLFNIIHNVMFKQSLTSFTDPRHELVARLAPCPRTYTATLFVYPSTMLYIIIVI